MNAYRVVPGKKVALSSFDANDSTLVPEGKKKGEEIVERLGRRLEELQDLLYAAHDRALLVVLQGMDTSGKDGAIRKVFHSMDPLGIRAVSFGVPSAEELDHDFLWRVHRQAPRKGEVVIFNRSHYEDVLAVRVRQLAPEKVWRKRYEQINDFERLLAESGTTIVKFFLHIDAEEQRERLQKRIDDPAKRWKFRHGDLDDRKLWKEYTAAYEEALSRTSTEHAPWYVVPANRKWYRNVVISQVLVETLESLDLRYPEPEESLDGIQVE